jgi:hypothetical protein
MRVPRRAARTAQGRSVRRPQKARSAQNALKHGLCAQKHIVLPDENAAEFAALEAALVEELAPVGALQTVLARRVAVAACRLARAERIEAELFEERRVASGGLGLALLGRRVGRRRAGWAMGPDPFSVRRRGPNPFRRPSDGNGPRSFETVCRSQHRLWWSVRSDQPLSRRGHGRVLARAAHPQGAPGRAGNDGAARGRTGIRASAPGHGASAAADRARPNEPERGALSRPDYIVTEPPARALHEPAAAWRPNEPESDADRRRAHLNQLPISAEPEAALSSRPAPYPRLSRRS